MPFTQVDLAITEVLETDFITDFRIITNANFNILKSAFEDLINGLEIDSSGITLGTSTPINSITTDVLVMQSTGFQFNKTGPVAPIASLTKNGSDQSVLNIDILQVDAISTFGGLVTANSLAITNASTFSGQVNLDGVTKVNSAFISSSELVLVTASEDSNNALATINLTSTSRQDIYVTLKLDSSLIVGTTIQAAWSGAYMKILLDFDATNPPAVGQTFNIHIVDIVNSADTSVLATLNAEPKTLWILPGVNNAVAADIYLNGGNTPTSVKIEAAPGTNTLVKYGHCASLVYHIDATTQDRLVVNSLHNFSIA
jgi:hypothetical protein